MQHVIIYEEMMHTFNRAGLLNMLRARERWVVQFELKYFNGGIGDYKRLFRKMKKAHKNALRIERDVPKYLQL